MDIKIPFTKLKRATFSRNVYYKAYDRKMGKPINAWNNTCPMY